MHGVDPQITSTGGVRAQSTVVMSPRLRTPGNRAANTAAGPGWLSATHTRREPGNTA